MKKIAYFIAFAVVMTIGASVLTDCINETNPLENHRVEKELTFDDIMKSIDDGTFFLKVPDCSDATCEEVKIDFLTVKLYSDFLDGAEDWLNNLDEEKIRYYKSTRCAKIKYGNGTKEEKLRIETWFEDASCEMGIICDKYSMNYKNDKVNIPRDIFHIPENIIKVITKSASEAQRRSFNDRLALLKI